MKPGLLFVFLLFSHSVFSQGSWSQKVLEHSKTYTHPFPDGFLSSLKGACVNLAPKYKNMVVPIEDFEGETNQVEAGSIPLKIGIQRDEEGNKIKAPVAIYIPGAFNNLEDRQPRRFMHEFTRNGYHSIVFPNPWGTEFVKRKLKKPVGHVNTEGLAVYEAMRHIVNELKSQDLVSGPVRLTGVSYGGYLTAMVSALDAESDEPFLTMDSTIFSPPFYLGETLLKLDMLVQDSKEEFIDMTLVGKLIRFKRVCSTKANEVDQEDLRDAKGLVVFAAFHDKLIQSVNVYDKVHNLDKIPDRAWGMASKKYRQWRRNFNFNQYFIDFAPSVKEVLKSESGKLSHWVQRARNAGYQRIRILSADDDFLNTKNSFPGKPADLLELHDGGHYGFRHLKWFDTFLNLAFKDQQELQFFYIHHHLDPRTLPKSLPSDFKPTSRPDNLDFQKGLRLD